MQKYAKIKRKRCYIMVFTKRLEDKEKEMLKELDTTLEEYNKSKNKGYLYITKEKKRKHFKVEGSYNKKSKGTYYLEIILENYERDTERFYSKLEKYKVEGNIYKISKNNLNKIILNNFTEIKILDTDEIYNFLEKIFRSFDVHILNPFIGWVLAITLLTQKQREDNKPLKLVTEFYNKEFSEDAVFINLGTDVSEVYKDIETHIRKLGVMNIFDNRQISSILKIFISLENLTKIQKQEKDNIKGRIAKQVKEKQLERLKRKIE